LPACALLVSAGFRAIAKARPTNVPALVERAQALYARNRSTCMIRVPLLVGPTPVSRLEGLCGTGVDVWCKDDGVTSPHYGGNKVRKLERLIALARARGAKRLVTVGGAGSHHVLACALFGRRFGLECTAALFPQPHTPGAEQTLRAILSAGTEVLARSSFASALLTAGLRSGGEALFLGPGGMGKLATLSYRDALDEFAVQHINTGKTPPDVICVAAGSGGTAAGLLAGVVNRGWSTELVAVQVAPNPALRGLILSQAWRALRSPWHVVRAARQLRVVTTQRSSGYGVPTVDWPTVAATARSLGLGLDPTYTGKAFSWLLAELGRPRPASSTGCSYLYWHTLSATSFDSLLDSGPANVPPPLRDLLTPLDNPLP
jgi:D-cysteine desulfhydrase